MEVLKNNFQELLPTIEKAIQEADFIAFDTELTGLNDHLERIKSFDSAQARYTKLRSTAAKFLIIQFGLCAFAYSKKDNTFVARPFNFYIFPANADHKDTDDVCFMCSGSSLHFLSRYGFDFNKLIGQGIPFMNKTAQEKLNQRRESLAQRQVDNPLDEDMKAHVEKIMKQVEKWVNSSQKEQLIVECPSVRQKREVSKEIKQKYDGFIVGDRLQNGIMFKRLTKEERSKRMDQEAEEEAEALLNFRVVIELLVKFKKPMLGHNCLLDLVHLTHQFWEEIPEGVRTWKRLTHELFELIIDTKHLASSHQKLKGQLPKNGVEDIVEAVQKPPFTQYAPNIVLDPEFTRYTLNDESLMHEAGYDAFMTGYNFFHMAFYMLHENEEKQVDPYDSVFNDEFTPQDPPEPKDAPPTVEDTSIIRAILTSEKLTKHYNKVHLLRSDFKYINFAGDDGLPPSKSGSFLITNIPPNTSQQVLNAIFRECGNIFFQWIDESNCWLTIKSSKKRTKMVEGSLRESKIFALYLKNISDEKEKKDITESMGKIALKSWENWLDDLLLEEKRLDGEVDDNQTGDEDDIADNEDGNIEEEEETFKFDTFPPAESDEWPQILPNEGTHDNWPNEQENGDSTLSNGT